LLFVLLDAAEYNGALRNTAYEACWQEAKMRAHESGDYAMDAEVYRELLEDLVVSGRLAGTWIEERWLTIKSRIVQHG